MCSGGSYRERRIVGIRVNNYRKMQRELEYQARKEADRRRKDSRSSTTPGRRDQRSGWRRDVEW